MLFRSEANQPTSLFQGKIIKLSGSGIANMSESAGVMSNQVANPAKPAPFFCISPIALAGTNFDLNTPKRSTKLIKKYFIFFCFAIWVRFLGISNTTNYYFNYQLFSLKPGIQFVPANGTLAIAAASIVKATKSSGSKFLTSDLPFALAKV